VSQKSVSEVYQIDLSKKIPHGAEMPETIRAKMPDRLIIKGFSGAKMPEVRAENRAEMPGMTE